MLKSQMMKLVVTFLFIQVGMVLSFTSTNIASRPFRRELVADNGDHYLICNQEPLELGIVLDSSSSLRNKDFKNATEFLQAFLRQYDINSEPNGVRVSIITYGKGIYPEIGFNLTTYSTSDEVINAIGNIPHRKGLYTDTGKAINFMHKYQLAESIVRPGVPKVSIVITDGDSQEWEVTKKAAEDARNDGIVMFAVGVGDVRSWELLNIAGNASRVTKVDKYENLNSIKESLAYQTCVVEIKTTTPKPKVPVDLTFIVDQRCLGMPLTNWAKRIMMRVINKDDAEQGYTYTLVPGLCTDYGFNLDRYDNVDSIKDKLKDYDRIKVPQLIQRTIDYGFTNATGARQDSCKVAVIIVEGKLMKELNHLHEEVAALNKNGIHAIIADPTDKIVAVPGAKLLRGLMPKKQAEILLADLPSLCDNQK